MWFILLATLFIAMCKPSGWKINRFRFSFNKLSQVQNYRGCILGDL
jgi:hypothetical protein